MDNSKNEELDPRVQVQLEKLNTCTDEINRLEVELDEANQEFRTTLSDSSAKLKQLKKKMNKAVEAARPFYDAQEKLQKAQKECQRAAQQFQRASEIHQAATETIMLAEQRFLAKQSEWQFDNAWQEMLNHATKKVTEAKQMKLESEIEHRQKATVFKAAEHELHLLQEKLKKDIKKSKEYFQTKYLLERSLDEIKQRIEAKQNAVHHVKEEYNSALKALELISSEIHHRRRSMQSDHFASMGNTFSIAEDSDLGRLLEDECTSVEDAASSFASSSGINSSTADESLRLPDEFVDIDLGS